MPYSLKTSPISTKSLQEASSLDSERLPWAMDRPPALSPLPQTMGWEPPRGRTLVILIVLLFLTFLTTLYMGAVHMGTFHHAPWLDSMNGPLELFIYLLKRPILLLSGIPYAIAVMLILGSHELGHYLYCRTYNVNATPPMFLPAPTLFGTFGAFIRIKSPIPSRKALFDIGIAGPLAGLIVTLPFLAWGIAHSVPASFQATEGSYIIFGEPLIWKIFTWIFWSHGSNMDMNVHPIALAAWFGLLATNLNLFPIGQLDGGHIAYALLGRRARRLGFVCWLGLVALVFHNTVWTVWTLLTFLIGFRHPPPLTEEPEIHRGRQILGWIALIAFILTFTPDPIRIVTT